MVEKKDTIEIIKVGIILFAITAIAAFTLALVNSFTGPVIAANNKKIQDAAMQKVLPAASEFTQVEFTPDAASSVSEIYSAGDAGVVVKTAPKGYGGEISMIVGIDNEYKVTGVEIISQAETAGLGAKCIEEDFRNQFIGKTEGIEVVKNGASGNKIDAITSATITSKATAKGVNEAISEIKKMRGEE